MSGLFWHRSIPAHAGEPRLSARRAHPPTVYPRPRGGTAIRRGEFEGSSGLSPPTRGNPCSCRRSGKPVRSIPAHAGEPAARAVVRNSRRVYPRPRGGTSAWRSWTSGARGLSPPTRGNPGRLDRQIIALGSIPAHAGEPRDCDEFTIATQVYPRPRGGTRHGGAVLRARPGLSPPTRGNRMTDPGYLTHTGSIPAHAGEPWRC